MATNTYVALDKVTVGTATTSITFSSINSGYTDLVIAASFLPSVSTNQPYIQFNADTGTSTTNYSTTSLRGDGSSAASGRHTNQYGWFPVPGPGIGTNGNPEPWLINIMNYSNTTTFKSGLTRFNNASSIVAANAHLWRSTAAITSVTITMETGNFAVGSTFSLYGIKALTVPGTAQATGGTISYDAFGNVYHTFTSSGTFTPTQSLTCDYLVVAGGGGGGYERGAGGGAGGLRSTVTATGGGGSLETPLSLSATGYTVTIGGGGAGLTGYNAPNPGVDSVFGAITSVGGGGGGGTATSARNGGSGGGGFYATSPNSPGTGTANQGYAGGNGFSPAGSGGGGGAGAVGAAAIVTKAGNGGAGVATSISGSSVTYAGGGGGAGEAGITIGTGGTGGGGNGTNNASTGGAGTANTGGGGGGGGFQNPNAGNGGAGGSGIVIVRYAN